MRWFGKQAATGEVQTASADELAAVRRELATALHELGLLRRDVADLDDKFLRWRGRQAKRQALDEADAPPANGAQPQLPSVAQLKAAGRYPWK